MTADQTGLPPNATDQRPFQFRLVHLIAAIAVVGAGLALIIPVWRAGRDAARLNICGNNLRQIALALHNYHDIYHQFPPAYQCDATGKPAHSWRVMIWNLMEAQPYFVQYNFSEPWNGPKNSTLASHISPTYRCPADSTSPKSATNYVAVVGGQTMWPGTTTTAIDDILDGTENTLMLVEISHSNIHWMEPRDLPIDELDEWLDPAHRPRLFGNHIEGGMVAYADGSVELLSRDVTIERLRALASRAGKDGDVARETKP